MSGDTGDAETLAEFLLMHAPCCVRGGAERSLADALLESDALAAVLAAERERGRTAEERARRALLDRIETLEARLAAERVLRPGLPPRQLPPESEGS